MRSITTALLSIALLASSYAIAGAPLWTFTPLTATTLDVPNNSTATVQYQITNQSSKPHTLVMQAIQGTTQITTGAGICGNPFVLAGRASCVLSLQINGNQLTQPITNGPVVCQQGSSLQCYRPNSSDNLNVRVVVPSAVATLSVSGSPLTLTTGGGVGLLTITNTSTSITATNIMSDFTGTALDGNVTESGNTCASVAPSSSCTLTYVAGSTVVAQTSFPIAGDNTDTVNADMQIDAGVDITTISPSSGTTSGGSGVTLTGSGFTGATSVTFGGTSATSVNVVNSTTVTAVTPAHAAGAVDVVLTTPSGSGTSINGYTYVTTAIGQSSFGGIIACLNGGLNNLIAATADNSIGIAWGGTGVTTSATSITNGTTNTSTIITAIGAGSYAAKLCDDFQIDSQGNTPCQVGNTCYNDWFLPAGNNATASGQLNCLYTNRTSIGGFTSGAYWSSTEVNATNAWGQDFFSGAQASQSKNTTLNVRCVRSFTP